MYFRTTSVHSVSITGCTWLSNLRIDLSTDALYPQTFSYGYRLPAHLTGVHHRWKYNKSHVTASMHHFLIPHGTVPAFAKSSQNHLKNDKIWSIMPLSSGLNVEVHIKTPLRSSESGRTRICAYPLYEPQYHPASSHIWKMTWRTFLSRNHHAQVHPPETMEQIVQVPIDPCRREEEVSDRSQSVQVSVSSFHPSILPSFLLIRVSSDQYHGFFMIRYDESNSAFPIGHKLDLVAWFETEHDCIVPRSFHSGSSPYTHAAVKCYICRTHEFRIP